MSSLKIGKALRKIPAHTRGVFQLIEYLQSGLNRTAIIANPDIHSKPGVHWAEMYVNSNVRRFYYDCFGFPLTISQHINLF